MYLPYELELLQDSASLEETIENPSFSVPLHNLVITQEFVVESCVDASYVPLSSSMGGQKENVEEVRGTLLSVCAENNDLPGKLYFFGRLPEIRGNTILAHIPVFDRRIIGGKTLFLPRRLVASENAIRIHSCKDREDSSAEVFLAKDYGFFRQMPPYSQF